MHQICHQLAIAATTSVDGVFTGTVITAGNYTANLRKAEIKNSENGFLYANLPESNISSVDLSNSQLLITKQIEVKLMMSELNLRSI